MTSQVIESRVVELIFDNSRFGENVQKALISLHQLDEKLKLTENIKGFKNLGDTAKDFDLTAMSSSVATVSHQFSALEIAAITAISNITNYVINLGKQMARSLTIEPIYQGFNEYELKMNSVQTIMASTGADIETVTGYLEQLNEYADKTIYSFSDMTSNIGKFTNAGVNLDSAVKAIKGISNEAAVSGANANEASRAMYNFAQALSAGSVKLIDWKSIENANMATIEFKQSLLDTAVAMGTVVKKGDKYVTTTTDLQGKVSQAFDATYAFNNSLAHQWMTTDVLIQTLGNYATDVREMTEDERKAYRDKLATIGYTEEQIKSIEKLGQKAADSAQDVKTFTQLMSTIKESVGSGWAQTFEIIFGNLEQAKKLWTSVAKEAEKIFVDPINARNEMLRDALGDRKMSLKEWKTFEQAGNATKEFKKALTETAKEHGIAVDEIIKEQGGFNQSLKEGWLTGTILQETIEHISEAELESEGYTKKEAKALKALAQEAKNANTPIGKITESLNLTGRDLLFGSVRNIFNGMMEVASTMGEAFREIFPATTAKQLYNFLGKINDVTSKFEQIADKVSDKFYRAFRGLFAVFDIFGQAASAVLKNVFPPFIKIAKEAFGVFIDNSAKIGDFLYDLSKYTREFKIFDKVIADIKPTVVGFLNSVQEKLKFINIENIQNRVSMLSDILSGALSSGLNRISSMSSRIGSFFKSVMEFFNKTNLTTGFVNIVKALSSAVASLGKAVGNLASKGIKSLFSALQSADYNTLFDIFNTILAAGLGTILVDFIRSLKNAFGTVLFNFKSVSSVLLEVKGVLVSLQAELKADVLMKIAKAIALIAGSMVALSLIDSEKLTSVLGAVSALVAEMVGVMSVLDTVSSSYGSPNKKGLGGMIQSITGVFDALGKRIKAGAIIEFGSAIMILAIALAIISAIDADRLKDSVVAISFLIGELAAAMSLMSFVSGTVGESFGPSAKGFKSFAIAILIMSGALYLISKIPQSDLENALMAITMMGAVITAMVGLTTVAAGQYGKSLKKMGGSMIAASISILILAKALSNVAKIPASDLDRSLQTIETLGLVITAIGGVMAIMGKNGGSFRAGLGLIEAATALMILSKALSSIGDLKAEQFEQGMFGIGLALTGMAVALNAMKGTQSGALSLVIAAAALNLLVPPIKALGDLSIDQIAKALITLAGTFLTLSIAGTALAGLTPTLLGISAAIVIFGVGIVAIGGGLTLIGTGLIMIATGITALGASLATGVGSIIFSIRTIILGIAGIVPDLIKIFGKALLSLCQVVIETAPAMGEAFKVLVLTALDIIKELVPEIVETALTLLIEVLTQLKDHAPEIVGLLLTLLTSIIDELATHIPEIVKSVSNLVSEIFGAIFDELTKLNSEEIQNAIFTVGLFSGMMIALAGLATVAPAAMTGVLGLGAVITELGAVMAAIGGLAQIPGAKWLVEEGGNFAQKIGTAVGQLIGGIVGGFVEGATSTLGSVGTALSNFMTNAKPFFEGVKSVDTSSFNNISSLATALLKLTAADLINGLSNFASVFTGHSVLSSFSDNLPELAAALTSYADNLGNSLNDRAKINSSKTLVEMLASLASGDIPKEGGLFQLIGGHSGLSSFYQGLPELGTALTSYADSLGDNLSGDKITKSETLIKMLGGLASTTIPKTDGLVQLFAGENGIGKFAEQLPALGRALTAYADSLGDGITADKVTSSITAVRLLASLQDVVSGQNNGGLVSSGDLTKFGDNITQFGKRLGMFYTSISEIETGKLTSLVASINAVANSTKNFDDINPEKISSLAVSFNELSKVTLDSFVSSINSANSTVSTAAANIVSTFSSGISAGVPKVSSAVSALMTKSMGGLSQGSKSAISAGKSMGNMLVTGFQSGASVLPAKIKLVMTAAFTSVTSFVARFGAAGKSLSNSLGNGLSSASFSKSITSKLSSAVSSARGYRGSFYNAGAYLADGLRDGINSRASSVARAAASMVSSALTAARAEAREASPSKATYEIGDYFGQGFVNAIRDHFKNAGKAGSGMVEQALKGTERPIRMINDIIQNGIDAQPTITPVLDLSQIKAGTGQINGLLGATPALAMAGDISYSLGRNRVEATNDDVVQAIDKLNKAIAEMPRESTTINGITYDDGSNINNAVRQLVRAARIERRS